MNHEDVVKNEYFDWLYNYVCKNRVHEKISYRKLLILLHSTEFIFTIYDDINRAEDGVGLRYRYAMEIGDTSVLEILNGPCSVLEMMVALAIKCEESIMDDPLYGNRTQQWFWGMISNIGLKFMTDDVYDKNIASEKIFTLLSRTYEPDGRGGLFYIRNCPDDLRDVDIWSQLCWYLDTFVDTVI